MQLSIKMNEDEMNDHEWLKAFFGFNNLYGEDSQTIKQAERTCRKVLQGFFGDELKDIFARKSKDELAKVRLENSQNANKGNTSFVTYADISRITDKKV